MTEEQENLIKVLLKISHGNLGPVGARCLASPKFKDSTEVNAIMLKLTREGKIKRDEQWKTWMVV